MYIDKYLDLIKPLALVSVTEPGTSSGVRSSNSKILIDAPTA